MIAKDIVSAVLGGVLGEERTAAGREFVTRFIDAIAPRTWEDNLGVVATIKQEILHFLLLSSYFSAIL